MSPISPEAVRRRRVVTRALPLVVIATAAFVAGAVRGAGPSEASAAERFAAAWAAQDFAAMHAELTPAAAEEHTLPEFTDAYGEAQRTATVGAIEAGEARRGRTAGGEDVAMVPLTLETHAFGTIAADLVLALEDDAIAWQPHNVFPGLASGERLERQVRVRARAPILALDGTPLAEGSAAARSSPLGSAAADVAGIVGQPGPERADELEALGFPAGTPVGTSGLELAFDGRLAGRPGGRLLAAGAVGERVLASSEPVPGRAVHTTIDPDLQRAAVAALAGRYGGVAALDARSGAVRALAGLAFSAPQPPGSTFKLITTVAALEAELVALDQAFPVQTSVVVGGREIANAHEEPCGGTFVESFAHSCNSVFAPLGPRIGSERLVAVAERFGFNEAPSIVAAPAATALELPSSTIPQTIPSDLELAVSAIGQGEVLATPLALASAAQAIADRGTREPTPLVTDRALRADAEPVRVTSPEIAATVRDLMVGVVTSGTGTAAAIPGIQVAGKTGTAELGPKDPAAEVEPGEQPEQKVDAWFTAFAPASAPRLAVAVMIVDAEGDGGEIAAPIAREVLAAGLGG